MCFSPCLPLPQDFPYHFEEGLEHHNVWASRPLSREELQQVKGRQIAGQPEQLSLGDIECGAHAVQGPFVRAQVLGKIVLKGGVLGLQLHRSVWVHGCTHTPSSCIMCCILLTYFADR